MHLSIEHIILKQVFKVLFISIFPLIIFSCKKGITEIEGKNEFVTQTIRAFEKNLLQSEIDSAIDKISFNGSIGVFQDSLLLYKKYVGEENFTKKTPITDVTVFAIGSVSKQFTAVLILKQVEANRLGLTDKVSKFLTEFQNKDYQDITIKELLNHTSGLGVLGQSLLFKPGTDFYYSNDGYNALGKILEKITGKSYSENAKLLFQEVGMKNSFVADSFEGIHFGSSYIRTLHKPEEVAGMPKRLAGKEVGLPAGGILSTVSDLHLWNQKLYSGKILSSEMLQLMLSKSTERQHPILGKMGYGLGIMMHLENPEAYFHTGYVKGSPSLNVYYPQSKTSLIILSNFADESQGKNNIFALHKKIKSITDYLEIAMIETSKELLHKNENPE